MKLLLTSFCFLLWSHIFSQATCEKCSIQKVKAVAAHLNNLTLQQTKEFLCTFDASCKSNAAFSEWSNETLFKVIEKTPGLFFQALKTGKSDLKMILNEIENPVHDTIDLQGVYDKLKTASATQRIKRMFLDAVRKAASKNGQQIKI